MSELKPLSAERITELTSFLAQSTWSEVVSMARQILRQQAEIAKLREDKERVDWLECWLMEDPDRFQIALRRMQTDGKFIVAKRPHMGLREANNRFGDTLRLAIDAAMKEGSDAESE